MDTNEKNPDLEVMVDEETLAELSNGKGEGD